MFSFGLIYIYTTQMEEVAWKKKVIVMCTFDQLDVYLEIMHIVSLSMPGFVAASGPMPQAARSQSVRGVLDTCGAQYSSRFQQMTLYLAIYKSHAQKTVRPHYATPSAANSGSGIGGKKLVLEHSAPR